ncbi:hypothetical protein L9F63_011305, partial [Diploptera punctata]
MRSFIGPPTEGRRSSSSDRHNISRKEIFRTSSLCELLTVLRVFQILLPVNVHIYVLR